MWKYNNTDELYHFGIPGMKWGHRTMTRSQTNRANFKAAKKDIKATWLKTAKKNGALDATDKQNKAYEKGADKYNSDMAKAKAAYKAEKMAIRGDINAAARRQRDASSFGERLLYNDATRRRAGKLMVERKMSEIDAVSKAKKEAWRNTGIEALGLMGLMGLMGIEYTTRIK